MTILVSTDFSDNSKAGIRFALQLASQTKAEIEFFHSVEIMKPTSWSDKRYKFLSQERIRKSETKLHKFVARIIANSDHKINNYQCVAEIGINASEQIVKRARKIKADYICLSTRGAGKMRKLFGTHASAIITSSPIPVMVVPKGYRSKPVRKLFYASDLANLQTELRSVIAFADLFEAETEIFHFDYLLHVEENRRKLERKSEKFASDHVHFNFRRMEIELPLSEHLKKYVQRMKPQIVILFTKPNKHWYDRLFFGSKSAEAAFHATTPLLIFRKRT